MAVTRRLRSLSRCLSWTRVAVVCEQEQKRADEHDVFQNERAEGVVRERDWWRKRERRNDREREKRDDVVGNEQQRRRTESITEETQPEYHLVDSHERWCDRGGDERRDPAR